MKWARRAPTRSGWRRAGTWALQLALTGAVTWAILERLNVSLEELGAVGTARWWRPAALPLVLSSVLLAAGFTLSAWFWGRLVHAFGGRALGPWEAARVYFLANLGRYLPGKLWQIAGLAFLAGERGVPPLAATGAAVLGQGLTLVGACLVGIVPLAAGGARRGPILPLWATALVMLAAGVLLVPPLFRRAVAWSFRLLRRTPPEGTALDPLFGLRWIALYAVNWAVYGTAFWIFARAFQVSAGALESAGAFAAAYFVGYIAIFAPAGIGVREGVLAALLAGSLPAGEAMALAVVARIWTTAVEVVPAAAFGVAPWLRGGARRKRFTETER